MLTRGTAVLEQAAAHSSAVAGLVAYNMEIAQGIVAAAEQTGVPVFLQTGSSPFQHAGMTLATIALALAESTDATIGVHLDHSRSLDEIEVCLWARLHLGDDRRLASAI
jgi:fructose/tagatose bisphosphate aldolase